ncbi:uncharacterized protein LOC111883762 [Lactuca sativa]|uniref:Uncharacterized protein n=1 Tax=Lactuca sativa TaxID=4236 RepID=A0A9R1UXQ1_LACSA|nr:uncharacterized protein LOC111883762 [Lactuca sativa]KAJ0194997.1 hypothetical protein LSAT_V11C700359370 [Lactuca sativa]
MYLLPEKVKLRINFGSISTSGRFMKPASFPIGNSTPDSTLPEDGPIELPFSIPSFISIDDDPTTLQVATNVLLTDTDTISIFLIRSLRRRAKRAKELKFRSKRPKTKKMLKEEALESLKAMTPVEANAPPLPLQAFLGGLSAGIIAIILYKFTTTIEASLNRQTIYDKIIPNS